MKCVICKTNVMSDQTICVMSFPLQWNNNSYGLLDEFFDKEKVVHYNCFRKLCPSLTGCQVNDSLEENFREIILSLDKNVSKKGIESFLKENRNTNNIEELTKIWFLNRNVFG